jgi:Tfp pilus assembly protein PilF
MIAALVLAVTVAVIDHSAVAKSAIAAKDYARAESEARLAVQTASKSGDAHRLLGTVYSLRGNLTAAVTEFRAAISINPKDANAQYNLGVAYLKLSKPADAVKAFTEAIRLNPKDAAAYDYRATAYDKLGNAKAAQADRQIASSLKKKTEVLR